MPGGTDEPRNPRPSGSRKSSLRSNPDSPDLPAEAPSGDAVAAIRKAVVDIGKVLGSIHLRPASFQVGYRRPDDLVVLKLIFHNFAIQAPSTPGGTAKLLRQDPRRASYLVAEFPPQSFGERAFLDATLPEVPPGSDPFPDSEDNEPQAAAEPLALPASIRMAGASRLACSMPQGVAELDFTIEAVLDALLNWPQRLDVTAAPEPVPNGSIPRPGKTWLKQLTLSADWSNLVGLLSGELEANTKPEIVDVLTAAAERVATQVAARMAAGRTRRLPDAAERMMRAEVHAIQREFPEIREEQNHDLALALFAMKASESLAAGDAPFGEDFSFTLLPFVPVALIPHQPTGDVTALELPYRLIVSPIPPFRWLGRTGLEDTKAGRSRTELWHVRLTRPKAGPDIGPDLPAKFRAIWSSDFPPTATSPPKWRMSLDWRDRHDLVLLMAGYNMPASLMIPGVYSVPKPSVARRMMLSALGAVLDSEGNWPPPRPAGVGLEQWRHVATMGRDHYVRVVYAGYLMPFGHHASLIKVTERKFEPKVGDKPLEDRVAVLRQRFFIVVREPVKSFPAATQGWFDFPFTQIEVLTRVTPNLRPPEECSVANPAVYTDDVPPRAAFWPMVSPNNNFHFEVAGTDLSGNRLTFSMPLLFIGDEANHSVPAGVIAGYNVDTTGRRSAPLGGAALCYAPMPADANAQGDTRLPTQDLVFKASSASRGRYEPQFDPHIESAEAAIPQLQRLLGQNVIKKLVYPTQYMEKGFGPGNAGEVFLQLDTPHELTFGAADDACKTDALGALAGPSMAIRGFSRLIGPVGGNAATGTAALDKVASGTFDPSSFFKDARILGGISLADILDVVTGLAAIDSPVPRLLSRDLPDRLEASYKWTTGITRSDPLHLFVPIGNPATQLAIAVTASTPLSGGEAEYTAQATLSNFKISLFGYVILWFDRLRFEASRGNKPDISVDLHANDESKGEYAVSFGGPLEFVNTLRRYIPISGSDVDVTPSGITASYSLNLPKIEVGVFSLTNASLGAGFVLPFDNTPIEARFNFSERQHPFSLTVSLFGGGGFFMMTLGSAGVRELEAALEFGGAVSIDLGVASGGVEVKGGVYFHWLQSKTVEFSGYIRLHGELSVIGIISASLTFNLQLAYEKVVAQQTSRVWGEASLVVEIDLLFFSASVSVHCRREFGGSPSDPSFAQLLPEPGMWNQYCDAFAAD